MIQQVSSADRFADVLQHTDTLLKAQREQAARETARLNREAEEPEQPKAKPIRESAALQRARLEAEAAQEMAELAVVLARARARAYEQLATYPAGIAALRRILASVPRQRFSVSFQPSYCRIKPRDPDSPVLMVLLQDGYAVLLPSLQRYPLPGLELNTPFLKELAKVMLSFEKRTAAGWPKEPRA